MYWCKHTGSAMRLSGRALRPAGERDGERAWLNTKTEDEP